MKDEFITFETAKLAKEKGFDEYCKYHFDQEGARFNNNMNPTKNSEWNNCMTQPTQSLLQRWLREQHGLHIHLYFIDNVLGYQAIITDTVSNIELFESKCFVPYEQALEEGLYEALKLIKTK